MEEVVICIATKLAECLWDPISRHARYLFCFNKFIGDVKKAKDELEVKLAHVNERKEEADRKTEEIMPSVKKWLDRVNVVLEEVQKLFQELEGGGNKCFNMSLKYSLAKQMEDKANKMKELKSNYNFEQFSRLIPLPGISTQFSSKEVMDFKSRKSTYDSLLKAIKDDKKKMVGLYGMGGSGKTTLAIEVGKEVEQLKLFDKVVKVVVSQTPNVRKIQEEIIGQTGLKFEEKTELTTAQRLFIGLSRMKILIILDDVWSSNLNLQADIGIPLDGNCCILLTTRLRDVCHSMHCERTFELSLLTREEALDLLMMHADLTNDSFNEFDDVGRKIVDECKGLPIAVVTVGSALRGKGIAVWKSTLWSLRHSLPLDVDESSRGPFACLKLSYDCLPSLAKQLFLLCSMFPEDHEIHTEDLIRFAKGTLEFEVIAYTMEDARNLILASITKLLDSCLLMHIDGQACVKIHDLVRDVALWITKKQHQEILVDSHAVLRTLVENETLKDTKAISLWNLENNFRLSNQLRCPTLEILLLHSDEGFIEDFGGIEALKVLAIVKYSFGWRDYYRGRIQWSMPQSIVSSLMNLHTLCFRGIALGDISFLCQLKRLEILDLHGSQFDELPGGIADMEKLKLLDVFGCEIKKNPLEVVQKCEKLEELYFWDNKFAIPKNFSLSGLKRYVIYDSIDNSFFSNRFRAPQVFVSCDEPLRVLSIQGFKVSDLNSSMKDLILRTNSLWLENCMWDHKDINVNIKKLVASACREKRFIVDSLGTNALQTEQVFPHLITLTLREMNSLEQVFQDSSVICSLPVLQELYIAECPKLTIIFTHATVTSLPKLRTLYIEGCNKVKWLFSYSLAAHCPSLEQLVIEDCHELERLIQEEVANGDRPSHRREFHHDLPNYPNGNETESAFLVVIVKSFKQLQNHEALTLLLRLKHVKIQESGRRNKGIFSVQVRGTIEGEDSVEAQEEPLKLISELCSLWLEDLAELEYIWKGPIQSVSLHRLEEVILIECPKLRNIFTFAIVMSLLELRRLEVYECEEWEEILCEESVKYLSSSSSSNVCFPKLQNIEIRECNKVKRLFSYSLASHCPSLEEINIWNCSELESLVDEEASHEDMPQLLLNVKKLCLRELPKLREIFGGKFDHKLESFHNKQECSPHKHKNENLEGLLEWEYIWKGPTQSVNLHRLESVRLWRCLKLRNIFNFVIVTSLPELRELKVYKCEEWEGILCEESVKYLSSSSSNVCFPKLQNIDMRDCNKVKRLFSYSLASHCPSLEQITIEKCSELESLVDEEASHEDMPQLLLNVKRLSLNSLPMLKEIFGGRSSEHKLQPYHNKQECSPHKHKNENLEGQPEWEYIWKGPTQSVSLHRLESVELSYCPKLRNIFTYAIVTSLPELRELEVFGCEEWEGIFCEESVKYLSSSSSYNVCFPKLENIKIRECNKVKRLFSYSLASHCPSLEKLDIRYCSELESLVDEEASHEDMPQLLLNVKWLSLYSLPILKEIFGGRSSEHKLKPYHNKQECSPHKHKNENLEGQPEWEYIWKGPTQSVSLHRLESVTLWKCSKLRNVFTCAIVTSLPELRELKVWDCEEWEGILCEESVKYLSSSSNVCFPKLQNIKIKECNKVKRLFSYSLASHCPSLEKLDIDNCSELESLVDEEASHEDMPQLLLNVKRLSLYSLPILKEIFGGRSSEHNLKPYHNKQECSPHKHKNERVEVVNSKLCSLWLQDLKELEYIWKGPTQSVSLHRLESVKLSLCPKLRNIFTCAIVTSLPELRGLEVWNCEEWEGIFCEESLKNLSSSTVCFPKLEIIRIFDCPKVRRLFSYSLASHCPSLKEITIWDCSQLEGVVQAYEGEVAGHHEKLFPKLNDLDLKRLPKLREIYPAYEFNHLSGTIHIEDCPNIYNVPLHDKTSSDLKIK